MPAKRKAASPKETSTATIGFEAGAMCEGRRARVVVKKSHPFDIRNSEFGIFPSRRLAIKNLAIRDMEADFGKEHADNFCSVERPRVRTYFVCLPYR